MKAKLQRLLTIAFFCGILLNYNHAFAQQVKFLPLSESLDLALKQNQTIIAASQEIKASEAKIREARLNWLPKFNFSADIYHHEKTPYLQSATQEVEIIPGIKIPASFLSSSGNKYYYSNLALSATNLLIDSGKVSSQIAKMLTLKNISEINFLEAKNNTIYKTKENYYKLNYYRLKAVCC